MNIAVAGMGLIGGSFCKALTKYTSHTVYGLDILKETIELALAEKTIKKAIAPDKLWQMDVVIVCLYPQDTIDFICQNANNFKAGSIVIDACGVKEAIIGGVSGAIAGKDFTFIPAHPMAGREFSGYGFSSAELFCQGYLILTPIDEDGCEQQINVIKSLAKEIGFCDTTITTPETHDRVISYTSQLVHILSNAYVKSDTLQSRKGFSAGSFLDMTRVSKLNVSMWSPLFILNRKYLIEEAEVLMENIADYIAALKDDDAKHLERLLQEGNEKKERDTAHNQKQV